MTPLVEALWSKRRILEVYLNVAEFADGVFGVEAAALVEADVPGRFDRNAVTLIPGHPVEVTFQPDDPGAAARFTTRDLYSATLAR